MSRHKTKIEEQLERAQSDISFLKNLAQVLPAAIERLEKVIDELSKNADGKKERDK